MTLEIGYDALELATRRLAAKLTVFVGGPFIDRTGPEPDAGAYGGAALLRYRLCNYIEADLRHAVSIGENEKLIEVYERDLETEFDTATMELMHIINSCDAVILLPSSPGSFCEFGLFAASNSVCEKMLVIREEAYLKSKGYLHYGPSAQAQLYNSKIMDVKYSDHDAVYSECKAFLRRIANKKILSPTRIR